MKPRTALSDVAGLALLGGSVSPVAAQDLTPRAKWLLELGAGAWWFTNNEDFPTGTRKQEPIFNFQAHLVHRFRPGFWASLDANYFVGGRQNIGGDELGDVLHNARIGGMVWCRSPAATPSKSATSSARERATAATSTSSWSRIRCCSGSEEALMFPPRHALTTD